MKNILLLTKLGILSAFSSSKKKGQKAKRAVFLSSYALSGLLMMGILGFYGYMLSDVCDMVGAPRLLLSLGLTLGMVMSLFMGIAKTPGSLFAAKDFQQLSSLPIKGSELFLSKLLLVYTFAFTGVGTTALPFSVVYIIKHGATVSFVVSLLLALIFVPMLVATVSGLIALVMSRIASRFRSTNAAMIVLSILFTAGIFFLSFSMGMMSSDESALFNTILSIDNGLYGFLPITLFINALNGSLTSLLALIALCVVPFSLFALLCARIFRSINISLGERHMRDNFKSQRLSGLKQTTVRSAMFKRELRQYTSTYVYVMNTIVGPIMALIFAGLMVFGGPQLFAEEMIGSSGMIESLILPLYIVMICFGLTIGTTTAASISLEGNRLWIIKSLPVSTTSIFRAKLSLQLLLVVPAVLISATAGALVMTPPAVLVVALYGVPLLYGLFSGLLGLMVNLLAPNLNWKNPIVPIKRGASVLITMLVNFLMLGIPIAIYALTGIDIQVFAVGVMAVVALICAGLWVWLKTKGVKVFAAL